MGFEIFFMYYIIYITGYFIFNQKSIKSFIANPPQSCIEFGHHYIGGTETVDKKDGVQSAEQCQSLCKADSRCNWFTWKDAANPTSCWLLTAKGTTKDEDEGRNQGATGPKTCFGRNIFS